MNQNRLSLRLCFFDFRSDENQIEPFDFIKRENQTDIQ